MSVTDEITLYERFSKDIDIFTKNVFPKGLDKKSLEEVSKHFKKNEAGVKVFIKAIKEYEKNLEQVGGTYCKSVWCSETSDSLETAIDNVNNGNYISAASTFDKLSDKIYNGVRGGTSEQNKFKLSFISLAKRFAKIAVVLEENAKGAKGASVACKTLVNELKMARKAAFNTKEYGKELEKLADSATHSAFIEKMDTMFEKFTKISLAKGVPPKVKSFFAALFQQWSREKRDLNTRANVLMRWLDSNTTKYGYASWPKSIKNEVRKLKAGVLNVRRYSGLSSAIGSEENKQET